MSRSPTSKFWLWMTGLATLAGVLYSSWPLGYWLNPSVSKQSLASGLEAVHQPYNWVFIGGDVASSLIIIIVSCLLWQRLRVSKHGWVLAAVLLNVIAFGVGTIIDALLPERCVPQLQSCPSFTQDHLLLVHGIFSIAASFCLFLSLLILWWFERRNALLNILMAAYVLFGVFSLLEAVLPGENGNWSQHYYITLCSIWLALLPYVLRKILARRSRATH